MCKTIIYFGDFVLPDGDAAAKRVMKIASYIKSDYKIVFISAAYNIKKVEKKDISGYENYLFPYPQSNYQKIKYEFSIAIFKHIYKLCNNVKAVICYNFPSVSLKKIHNFCKSKEVKVISDCTEWYEIKNILHPMNFLKKIDVSYRMKYINKKVDGVIAVSSFLKAYYDNSIFVPTVSSCKVPLNYQISNYSKLKFIFAGNCGKGFSKERLDIVIMALNILYEEGFKNFELFVFGMTENDLFNYGLDKITYPFLKCFGKVTMDVLIKNYSDSNFSIIPREEKINTVAGFPTKLSESLLFSVPVIATSVGDIQQFVNDCENGFLVRSCDVDSFYYIFKKVLSQNKDDLYEMRIKCKDSALLNNNFKDEVVNFLHTVLEGGLR